ncbi:hypothetical protein [Marinobacter sp. tcs-11]|uniref:hypothetical protein n=1 Tax=Marinobacter sp. tcs-11 TaxID=1742860 RepID=UPI002579DE62|nr:hypothetical protein [Marinobacter sp. tcs-11]
MQKYLYSALFALAATTSPTQLMAAPAWPTVEIVQPKKIEVTAGCRNPAAEAWEAQQQDDLMASTLSADEFVDAKQHPVEDNRKSDAELPAYLRGDH